MAYRDAETGAGDARRVAQRWLREFWLADWGLKLLALLITLVLWFAVTGQRSPATINLRGVSLEFIHAAEVEISNDPMDEVSVTLEGSRGKLDEINARNLVGRVDISQLRPGERVLHLSERTLTMDLPQGVRIVRTEPQSVALKLERSVERDLDVEARLEGDPADGFEVRSIQVNPNRVRVRGPESRVATVERAYTETISLDGQRETLTLPQIAVDITDRKVISLDPAVAVRIEIGEESEERRVFGVAVRSAAGSEVSPSTATVMIRGPRTVIRNVRADELEIIIEQAADGTLKPRLSTSAALNGRVELVSTAPANFTLTN